MFPEEYFSKYGNHLVIQTWHREYFNLKKILLKNKPTKPQSNLNLETMHSKDE